MQYTLRIAAAMILVAGLTLTGLAQRGPVTAPVDVELERMAEHNLTIADYYYSKKKAYTGALDRLLEVVDAYPEFTRIDEVYFLAAECYVKAGDPAKARGFFERLVRERPQSAFAERARTAIGALPAPAPKSSN